MRGRKGARYNYTFGELRDAQMREWIFERLRHEGVPFEYRLANSEQGDFIACWERDLPEVDAVRVAARRHFGC